MAEIQRSKLVKGPTIANNSPDWLKLSAALAPATSQSSPIMATDTTQFQIPVTPYNLPSYDHLKLFRNWSPKPLPPEYFDHIYNIFGFSELDGPHQSRYFLVTSERQFMSNYDPERKRLRTGQHYSASHTSYDFVHNNSRTGALRSATSLAGQRILKTGSSLLIVSGRVNIDDLLENKNESLSLPNPVAVEKVIGMGKKDGYVNLRSPSDTFVLYEIEVS